MSREPQKTPSEHLMPCESRSELIGRFVKNHLAGTIEKQIEYADSVRVIYEARHPDPDDRQIRFHHTDDAYHDLRQNRQVVMRRLKGEVKFEAEFEEACVLALPGSARQVLLRMLAARYGLLPVPIPRNPNAGAAELARLLKEVADAVESYGYLMEGDNEISHDDPPELLEGALAETDELLAVVITFRQHIVTAIGYDPEAEA